MPGLQEMATTRAALLLAENRLPLGAGVRVHSKASNAVFAALHRLDLLNRETRDRLFSGNFMISAGVDLAGGECDEETLWRIAQHGVISLNLNRTTTSSHSETRLLLPTVVAALRMDSPFLRDLRHLDIGGSSPSSQPFKLLPILNRFSSLESLVMSEAVSLSNDDLSAIASHHSSLRFLDISNCPAISDIAGLRPLRQLEVIRMHGLSQNMEAAEIGATFRAWTELKELDISCCVGPGADHGVVLLNELDANGGRPFWPHLHSIDLSGLFGRPPRTRRLRRRIQLFIDSHHQLANLSILATPLSRSPLTASDGRQILLASAATATHAKRALAIYSKAQRSSLAGRALEALLTRDFIASLSDEDCIECSTLVETAMRFHSSTEDVQEHGAHCQYLIAEQFGDRHILEGDDILLSNVPAALLTDMLERCMEAAEAFPQNERISDLTLYLADRVRIEVDHMDYLRIMQIGLKLMVKRGGFIDDGFYLINDCPGCMTTTELDLIVADRRIVPVLLYWINSIFGLDGRSGEIYSAMKLLSKFAGGRPAVCRQIVENDGVAIAFRVALDTEENDRSGALSLLASLSKEESSVQHHLIRHEYMKPLFDVLVRPPNGTRLGIPDQFLAGFIISHLLTSADWDYCGIDKAWANQQLISASLSNSSVDSYDWLIIGTVELWLEHNCVVMNLPAFFPDLFLLNLYACAGAQLWVLWSIRDACRVRERFVKRFREEGGRERLEILLGQSKTLTVSGKQLAMEIRDSMDSRPVEP